MYETFLSDVDLFNNNLSFMTGSRDEEKFIEKIKEKHKEELKDQLLTAVKKDDLIIWNAVYVKEIIKKGVSKNYLHTVYNKYYKEIHKLQSLKELQTLELRMAKEYFHMLINDIEITDNFLINKMIQYLYINIENTMSLKKLSKDLNISLCYAEASFKNHMGISLMKYSKRLKIERAKILLLEGEESILDIAMRLGFYDQSHFTKVFKSYTGKAPSDYRNKNYL